MMKTLENRIDAAQGKIPCDWIIRDVTYLDVFSCEWRRGDLAIAGGAIVGTEPGLKGHRTLSGKGKWVVPGFIDAHVHIESSMMLPAFFEEAVLNKGTTTAICDPHELANVTGVQGIQYFLDEAQKMSQRNSMDLWVMLSSCVPATQMETNGGGEIRSDQLSRLASHNRALGLAEMMNMPGVLMKDPEVLKKLQAFSGFPIDGHCPLLRGQELSAYAAAGISSCHESSELEEAREKLSKGISVWIREGSVAKDLKTLYPLLTLATSTSLGFCTDDRNPYDIAEEGHIDHLVRKTIQWGVPPEVVFRTASWSVARHYGLIGGAQRVGAIAPGYQADLIVLDDWKSCSISKVMKKGGWVDELDLTKAHETSQSLNHMSENSIRATVPEACDLEPPQGQVHVIGVLEGKIISEHRILDSQAPGVAKLSVLERYGKGSKPANAYVQGFGPHLNGAIASSVGHDSHNLIVVGTQTRDMRTALASLIKSGGGFCVVQNGSVLGELPLPFGGLMSNQSPQYLTEKLKLLKDASRAIGCTLSEPFLQLAFLSLPVIPALKLTDRGLVDVKRFEIIPILAT